MIKFFRNIRKDLMENNPPSGRASKTGKPASRVGRYFKYAVGEIILVVIGILIALQINTWNESRKEERVEKQVLRSLFQEIEKDRVMFKNIDYEYKKDLRKITFFKNLIWKENLSMEEALALKEFDGISFRDVNPNRITYDEMISTGKIYYLSNQTLLNEIINYYEIIESYVYQLRQDRVEYRSNFYDLSTMTDYWLTNWDYDNKELAFNFANNQTTQVYKNLKIISSWSLLNTKVKKESIANLYAKASNLQKLINEELDYSLIPNDNSKLSNEGVSITDPTQPKKISDLIDSGENIDTVVEMIKKQDKDNPDYFISEREINLLGYVLMRQDNNDAALKLFKLNTELYPDAYNTYDSFGECLLKMGDIKNGIKAYKKSLELNPDNTNAKIVLSEFQ